jgi:hypothetical protein
VPHCDPIQDYARYLLSHRFDIKNLAALFEFSECSVRNALSRRVQEPDFVGPHQALAAEIDAFRSGKSMTRNELFKDVRKPYYPELTTGWVNLCITRLCNQLPHCRSLAQEEVRMLMPQVYLEDHMGRWHMRVTRKFAEFVFTHDQLDSADSEPRQVKTVIASS